MPTTNSPMRLSERREEAFAYFLRGWRDVDIAAELQVSEDTVARYRKLYQDSVDEQARNNPDMLVEVVKNTIKALEENDLIRQRAWEDYERASEGFVVECDNCNEEMIVPAAPKAVGATFLKIVLQAQEQRSKLFGLFGVKQEFYMQVSRIKNMQDKLIEFMRRSLCADCRRKTAEFLRGQEPVTELPELPATTADA